ncbi:MAG: hypothetical protein C0490_11300 [Marivirga sp.]|nr:hypothetical protein [Marivirga sp.]
MKKVFILIFVAIGIITKAYSQCACCAVAGTGSSNGDYNNGILTLSKKTWVVEGYADYRTIKEGEAHHGSEGEEEETPLKSLLITSLGIRYGITDKITISALLPYAFLQTDIGNDKGIGDLILLGTFNLFAKNNFNLALQGGIELPTGIQKGSDFDNTTVVVGSGSVDPMAGLIFSKRWNKLTLQGNGLYKHTTKGFEENYYGSLSLQNISLAYQLKGDGNLSSDSLDHAGHTDFGWTIFGGYYGEWLDNIKEEDIVDENSGYYLGFATVGTNLSYRKWSFTLTVSLPIIQQMNGEQNDAGLRLRLGINMSF